MTTASPSTSNRPALLSQIRTILQARRIFTAIATILFVVSATTQAWAIPQTTATTLAITSASAPVTTVASPAVITLTASVVGGTTPITTGQVNFCDAAATYCTDIHILGTAQLTTAGTAIVRLTPGIGTHSYKAVFLGTNINSSSSSGASPLTVTGTNATATTIALSGVAGNYTLKATVLGVASPSLAPTGTVSFLDTTNSGAILGTSTLVAGPSAFAMTSPGNPTLSGVAVTTGDFNGDGKQDFISVDNAGNLTTALGNGDGTFKALPPAALLPYTYIEAIAVCDFNSDGIADLAIVGSANNVTVLMGNGDGTFTIASTPVTGHTPAGIAIGDWNGDGKQDLAITNYADNSVTVLLGNGDGTFTAAASPVVLTGPSTIRAADFNGDGKQDLAVVANSTLLTYPVTILFGKGDGTFTPGPATGANAFDGSSMTAGDFNNDGKIDIATTEGPGGAVLIYLGKGDGTFNAATTIQTGLGISGTMALGDFNGDGKPDIAVVDDNGNGHLGPVVLLGNGDGTFTASGPFVGLYSNFIAVTDFNGDGNADVVFLNGYVGNDPVDVLLTQSGLTATASVTGISPIGSGLHPVQASYSGDIHFTSSISATTEVPAHPLATTLTLTTTPTTSTYAQQIVLTATQSPYTAQGLSTNGETVSFFNGLTSLGGATLSSGVATLNVTSLPAGTSTLLATYPGDSNFSTAGSSKVSYAVAQATPVVTWNPPATALYTGTPINGFVFNASSATTGFYSFTFTPTGGTPASITPNQVLPVGSYTLNLVFTPTDKTDFTTVSQSKSFTVTPATLTVVPANATRVYGATNPTFTGTVTGAVNGETFSVVGTTTATTTSPVATYPITYTVSGVTGNVANYTVINSPGTLTITQATPTITWPAPAAITYGTPLTATQLTVTAAPTPGTFVLTPTYGTILPVGTQTLSVTFTPTDTTNYKPVTATVSLIVNKAPLSLTANNTARVFGAANPAFTGTINGAVNGDTFTESFATVATPASIVGSYPIVPSATGTNLANYTVTPTNGALTISQAGTATTFALSNSNLTLTATVAALASGTPTGTVAFYEGQTQIGTGTLANGIATYTATSFPAGDVVVSAQYSGDVNFTQSASPPIFVLAVSPASTALTVARAGTVSDVLTLSAAPGYAGTVQFSCAGLPAATTCSFQPASAVFTGASNTASVTVTIQTGVTTAALTPASLPNRGTRIFGIAAAFLWMPTLLLAGSKRNRLRRTPIYQLTLLLLLACMSIAATGCGSSPSTPSTPTTSPGTSTVQVVASGPASLSQTTSISLTVQ